MKMASRFRAKGEEIIFKTEEGEKTFNLKPIKNRQLLEVAEFADKKQGLKAAILLAKHTINNSTEIVEGIEKPFTDDEMEELESPFLFQLMKVSARLNGLEDMFDFQRGVQTQDSGKDPYERNLELINNNPSKKIS